MRSASDDVTGGPGGSRGHRLAAAALAAAAVCGSGAAVTLDGARPASSSAFRLTAAAGPWPPARQNLPGRTWSGGRYDVAGGEAVTVFVSDAYSADPTAGQRWANYLGSLVHGSELADVEAHIVTPDEVGDMCGADALGCYGNDVLIASGEPVEGVSPEQVVAHEYGHHIAHHRANPPWRAVDWGTKRWATHAGICPRAAQGQVFPGDEDWRYALNPGEAFAESYRILNERRSGADRLQLGDRRPQFLSGRVGARPDRARRARCLGVASSNGRCRPSPRRAPVVDEDRFDSARRRPQRRPAPGARYRGFPRACRPCPWPRPRPRPLVLWCRADRVALGLWAACGEDSRLLRDRTPLLPRRRRAVGIRGPSSCLSDSVRRSGREARRARRRRGLRRHAGGHCRS